MALFEFLFNSNLINKLDDFDLNKVFSQYEEDGLLLYLFSLLHFSKTTFVEFGSDDGINSNSANLAIHHGFSGLFIDGNKKALERGEFFYRRYVCNLKSKNFFHEQLFQVYLKLYFHQF